MTTKVFDYGGVGSSILENAVLVGPVRVSEALATKLRYEVPRT